MFNFNVNRINSMWNAASDNLQKQWEKNPTTVTVAGLALGFIALRGIYSQINRPALLPEDMCVAAKVPNGTRGEFTSEAQGQGFHITGTPKYFNFWTLGWSSGKEFVFFKELLRK